MIIVTYMSYEVLGEHRIPWMALYTVNCAKDKTRVEVAKCLHTFQVRQKKYFIGDVYLYSSLSPLPDIFPIPLSRGSLSISFIPNESFTPFPTVQHTPGCSRKSEQVKPVCISGQLKFQVKFVPAQCRM